MPRARGKPPRPAWRTQAPRPVIRPGDSVRRWRRGAVDPRRRSRALGIGLATLGFLGCAGLFLWVVLWFWPPPPTRWTFLGAGYEENLAIPHNVHGWEGLKGLQRAVAGRTALRFTRPGHLPAEPRRIRADEGWGVDWGRLREKTVVLTLALHGGADTRGPYLLPDDADPFGEEDAGTRDESSGQRIRLDRVLADLKRLPARKNKVLILDATQVPSLWSFGILQNDFAGALKALDPAIRAVPNLVVLSASDVGQRSWTSSSWRQSAFAHYLISGLDGAAAGKDGRVSAWELHEYARSCVARWARDHRGASQTPVLLPLGEEGERRARSIELAMIAGANSGRSGHATEPPGVALDWESSRPEVVREWERAGDLRDRNPAPAACAPIPWSRYLATLVRFEQLVRAGGRDLPASNSLLTRLRRLEDEIRGAQDLGLSASLQNTLAMPAIEGRVLEMPAPARQRQFNSLWGAAKLDDAKKAWEGVRAEARSPQGEAVARVEICDLLARRVESNPAEDLEKARVLLREVLDPPARPRPTEVHYLAMVARDLPRTPPPPEYYRRLVKAIRLRLLAERRALALGEGRYPYSEQVVPWIRDRLREADRERRSGEDLLFASDPTEWSRAERHLDAARAFYDQAQVSADQVRAALEVRDRVLPLLADYARWAALKGEQGGALAAKVEGLCGRVHGLLDVLEAPAPAALENGALARITEEVRRGFESLEGGYRDACRDLADADSPEAWDLAEEALAVPFADVDLRARLWDAQRRASGRSWPEAPSATPEESDRYAAARQAHRQGHMALAVLGNAWIDRTSGDFLERFQDAEALLEMLAGARSLDRERIARAGELVGLLWTRRVGSAEAWLRAGLETRQDRPRERLRDADRIARQLDGASSQALSVDPAGAYRRWLARDLLLDQAGRAFEDHWYSEEPGTSPYYREAGLAYVGDAETIDPRSAGFRDSFAEWKRKLAEPSSLEIAGPSRFVATSEQRIDLEYRLRSDAKKAPPPGIPVVWVEPGEFLRSIAPEESRRLAREIGGPDAGSIRCRLSSPLLDRAEDFPTPRIAPERSKLTVRGLFRGRPLERATALEIDPIPETVAAHHPPPPEACLAVRGQASLFHRFGESAGSVAIVLDCSGSMGRRKADPAGARSKFEEATEALDRVLQGISRGTRVSLWVFGERIEGREPVKVAEETIDEVQPPIVWDPVADPGQRTRLMARVRQLTPWNFSPIVRTMLYARRELQAAPSGFKSLLVITDGEDDRFAADDAWNPGRQSIPTALREQFFDTNIEIDVVGFKVEKSKGADKARAQFGVVEQFPTPGKFYTVDESVDLAATLQRALRKRLRFRVETEGHARVEDFPESGQAISQVGANEQWTGPLAAGGYVVRVPIGERLEKDILLGSGDRLILTLVDAPRGPEFARGLFSEEAFWKKYKGEPGRQWCFALMQDQLVEGRDLQMLVTLEKTFDRREETLQVHRPRAVWLEARPRAGPASGTPRLRWGNREGYPGPSWGLSLSDWPVDPSSGVPSRPVVTAWWNADRDDRLHPRLGRGADFEIDSRRGEGRVVRLTDGDVVLEGVSEEAHSVEIGPNRRGVKTCLVVRLAFDPDHPVMVRPEGFEPDGHEHRFYERAGKYTGIFWTVNADKARRALTHLELISLSEFKADCEARGDKVELSELGIPDAGSVRPLEIKAEVPLTLPLANPRGAGLDLPEPLPASP